MNFSMEQLSDLETWAGLLIPYGVRLLGAIAIFLIGRWVTAIATRLARRSLERSRMDETVIDFLETVLYLALMAFVVIAALSHLGVKTTAAAAIVGGMAVALGLSLQGQISSVAAGILLIFFRPLRKGDFVQAAGQSGTVIMVTLVNTRLLTLTNQEVTIPNNQVWDSPIINYSARDTRMMSLTVSISLAADIDRAKALLREIAEGDERTLSEPPPAVVVNAITESSVDILFRPWFALGDYWPAYWDMVERIKKEFDANGIGFARQRRFIELSGPAGDKAALGAE